MRNRKETFGHLPVARKLLLIVGVFVAIVACVFYLGVLRSQILSGVRAYVGGESLWSKGEKRAVLSLTVYAKSRAESDYQQYLEEIAVPLGDHIARLELQTPSPDMAVVARGLVQGRNSPEDVANMAMLFRRFGRVEYMARAIKIWTDGDVEIDRLRDLAGQLHQEVNSPRPSEQKIQQLVAQIGVTDAEITPLEDDFSSILGEGARRINQVLSAATLIATIALLLVGIGLSISVLNRIRDSEEKYRNLIDTANDAILIIDANTRVILEANSKACTLLGISEAELVGMHESQIYPQRPLTPGGRFLSAQSGLGARGQQLDLLRADGTSIPVEVSASAAEVGGRRAVLGIFRDVRDRLEAAAVLRRSEDRFGYLIQNLSDLITVVSVDGTMLYHSPSVVRVAGYEPSQLVGKSFLEFVHPEDDASVRSALEQVTLRTGTASPPEFRFRHHDGSWIWLEAVANNLVNDVAIGGIVVTSRDVTRRRLLEEQVRQSQKMEAVGRLAGGIAHDFNNLLMVIRGYAEIVLQEVSSNSTVRTSVETVIRTTESAASLTRQLLSFSRKHVFTPQILEMNSLVNQMSEMLRGLLGEELKFAVKLSTGAGCISADPGQVEQVIMNLVVNARDAMPKGGILTLETAHTDVTASGSASSSIPAGNYVMLTVSDTGVGMDSETQSRIFEPFFTTKSKDEGTGLGLSVVYNIVRGSGGYVRVQSERGRGSTFQILFPRVDAPATHPPIKVVSASSQAGSETILVAEDQPDLRWMICQFLQELGYSVLEARDGTDAVALAGQYKGIIDLLLTDVVMPGVRGPEVARQIAATRPEMKVIFMSGYTEGGFDLISGPDSTSAHALLQKPFELHVLANKIREVIEMQSQH
jgi:PAS domain S-box-containing protein